MSTVSRRWLPQGSQEWIWVAVLVASGAVAFGALFNKNGVVVPAVLGGLFSFAVVLVIGSVHFGRRSWPRVCALALWGAVVLAVTTLGAAAPADSSACDAPSDCDTSFGLGLPFLVVAYWLPCIVLAAIGGRPRRRKTSTEQPN